MRGLRRGVVIVLAAAGIVAWPGALQAQEGPEAGRGYPSGEWPLVGGDWSSSRYSSLDDITLDTVDRLGGAWATPLPGGAASRATPVVRDAAPGGRGGHDGADACARAGLRGAGQR